MSNEWEITDEILEKESDKGLESFEKAILFVLGDIEKQEKYWQKKIVLIGKIKAKRRQI